MTTDDEFKVLAAQHRGELRAHCYRMLGSIQDADDAVQETLLAAWRGLGSFEERSSLRTWLYTIATHACLRIASSRPRRMLSFEHGPACVDPRELGGPVSGPVWIEPYPNDPADSYARREDLELAFVAALQHLPGTQRAVLILREVLGFSAEEAAAILETTPASVNSALQRARAAVEHRVPPRSQQAELAALGDDGRRALVDAFVSAWERADVPGLLQLLTADARFTMPPLPAWFDGREAVARFLAERLFRTPWRLAPISLNDQLAFACYQGSDDGFRLGAVNVLSVRNGQVSWIAGFVDPELYRPLGLDPQILSPDR